MSAKAATVFILLAAAIQSATAQIDFTPQVEQYTAAGFTHSRVTFKSDKGTVTFHPPDQWSIKGDKQRVRLIPLAANFAEAVIQTASSSAPSAFDEAKVKLLEQQALQDLPPGAQSAQVVKRIENPVVMGSDVSFGFLLSYQTAGYNFQRSVIFVNRPDQQLVFRFTAPKSDYEKFVSDFHRSLSSWQWNEKLPIADGAPLASK